MATVSITTDVRDDGGHLLAPQAATELSLLEPAGDENKLEARKRRQF